MKNLLSVATVLALLAGGTAWAQTSTMTPGSDNGTTTGRSQMNQGATSGQTLPPSPSSGSSVGTSTETSPPGTTGPQTPGSRATGSSTGPAGGGAAGAGAGAAGAGGAGGGGK